MYKMVASTPKQNGLAKRWIKSFWSVIRCMLLGVCLLKFFQNEIANTHKN